MLIGSPLLATWMSDGTLRAYEFVSDEFVPLGVTGGLLHTTAQSPTPNLWWMDDAINIMRTKPDNGNFALSSFDLFGTQIAANEYGTPSGPYRSTRPRNQPKMSFSWDNVSPRVYILNRATGAYDTFNPLLPNSLSGKIAADQAASGRTLGVIYNPGTGNMVLAIFNAAVGQPVAPWTYSTGPTRVVGAAADAILRITTDETHALVGVVGEQLVRVFGDAKNTLTPLPDIPLSAPLRTIAVAPFGRLLAISTLTGGTYTTQIYRKVGELYQHLQEIVGIGALLDFSADGTLLVDSQRRLVYRWNALTSKFVEVPGAGANITVGSSVQALSQHAAVVFPTNRMYAAGVREIAEQSIDPQSLKLTLLNSSAPAFDAQQATFAAAAGGAEITAGLWPAGGISLDAFFVIPVGSDSAGWSFSNPKYTAVGEPIVFRSCLVYQDDGAGGIPLMRLDFPADVGVPSDNIIEFIIPTRGLLTFAP